jgi:exosortase/archaeosortase
MATAGNVAWRVSTVLWAVRVESLLSVQYLSHTMYLSRVEVQLLEFCLLVMVILLIPIMGMPRLRGKVP